MNILITGGAGFIGSHIVDSMNKLRHCVSIVDNLSTGNMSNVNKRAQFHNIDICRADLKKVFREEKPDIVMHYAANTMVSRSMEKPAWDARQNILGSINLIILCARFNMKRIIYASSAAIYGITISAPLPRRRISLFLIRWQTYCILRAAPRMCPYARVSLPFPEGRNTFGGLFRQ